MFACRNEELCDFTVVDLKRMHFFLQVSENKVSGTSCRIIKKQYTIHSCKSCLNSIFALIRLAAVRTRASDPFREPAFQVRIPLTNLLYLSVNKNPSHTFFSLSLQGREKKRKK